MIHRIGGGSLENLRPRPIDAKQEPPGISVLKADTAAAAARQMREAYPKAYDLHDKAKVVGTTTEELIRQAGFDLVATGSRRLPNHYRITHPDGVDGFTDENLKRLAEVFTNTET